MSAIDIIGSVTRGRHLEDVSFKLNDKKFILGIPDSVLRECERRGIDSSFFTENVTPSYYGCEDLAELESKIGLEGFADRVSYVVENFGSQLTHLIEQASLTEPPAGTTWSVGWESLPHYITEDLTQRDVTLPRNGMKYGVTSITQGISEDGTGRGTIEVSLHERSFFTSLVMDRAYHFSSRPYDEEGKPFTKHSCKIVIEEPNDLYGVFSNSFGLDTSIVVQGPDNMGSAYVFHDDRIDNVLYNGDKILHVAMRGDVRPATETANGPFTLSDVYKRNMTEKMGITDVDSAHADTPEVREL